MKDAKRVITLMMLLMFWLSGCTEKPEQSPGLEQIHQEQGLPVQTVTLQPVPFSTWIHFNTTLQGIEQSNRLADIGATVDRVLASVGDPVVKDQVIVTFPTEHPQAHFEQSRVAYENAAAALARLESLFGEGGVSRQELDNVRLQYDLAEANWNLSRRTVEREAPISGRITSLLVRPSDNVVPEDHLFTVARTDSMRTRVWLSEEEFLQVNVGTPVVISWQGMTFNGSIVQLDQAINRDHGGFGATLLFPNPVDLLKPGITVEAKIRTYHNPAALVVAFPQLVNDPTAGQAVYLAEGDQALLHPVTTGRRQGLNLEITSGLQGGEQLIVTGQQMLEDGTLIRLETEED